MHKDQFLLAAFFIFFSIPTIAQDVKVGCIGFYNFENLFDTLDTPDKYDYEFTPTGDKVYNTILYSDKLKRLARVVSSIGTEFSPHGVSVLGVAEVENRAVLEDFVGEEQLRSRNYQIIHYESPDTRGIDCALIYNPQYFRPIYSEPIKNEILDNDSLVISRPTRDILYVKGLFETDTFHVFVNHWPSRYGGEAATRYLRNYSADLVRARIDQIQSLDPNAKIVVMGDMNDEPNNESILTHLGAKKKKRNVFEGDLFGLMYKYYKKGIGTLAYRDNWSLFDQLIISEPLLNADEGYRYLKAGIYKKKYMITKTGQYKGYPLRTFSGNVYNYGYSDHFPVYFYIVKPI